MQIVAPAGSYNGLIASVCGGADAVYLGMPKFGARAKADNFDLDGLNAAVKYAHAFGVKVFVTLNTLIKDGETSAAIDAARAAYDLNVDAAIVQDIRFIQKLKSALPDFTLHASTQMGIHNAAGAAVLKNLGISRAVLSRETLPQDIVEIKQTTGIDVEYFVQGALCVCFSGNCYFSSLASSYSGNRGKCMQLCRKPYMFHGKRGYFLSAKDLCLYDKLEYLQSLGVDAIKIEGRMRSCEYAYRAVSTYKSAMPSKQAVEGLKSVFNRGDYCEAYLSDKASFNVIYPQTQSNIGKPIGKISSVCARRLTVNGYTPNSADGFKIMRHGREICGASVINGTIIADGNCIAGDELRLTFDGALSQELKSISRKLDIGVNVKISTSAPIAVTLDCGAVNACVTSEFIPQAASSCSITQKDIVRAFEKTAEYPFAPHITAEITGEAFVPMSLLNDLRRKAYEKLYAAVLDDYRIVRSDLPYIGLKYNKFDGHGKIIMVENTDQLSKQVVELADYIALSPRDYANFTVPDTDKPILLNLPPIMRGDDCKIIARAIDKKGIYGIISNNLYTLSVSDKPILLGPMHNIISKSDLPHIRSFEADENTGGFEYAFGYAPVMTLCHCPYGHCVDCDGDDELIDESGRRFKMRRYKLAHCYWQLLNCVPHDLSKQKNNGSKDKFYDCTTLCATEIVKAVQGDYSSQYTLGNINKGLK